MPTYDYKKTDGAKGCPLCENPFEVRQSISDPKLTKCPQCRDPILRCISAVGVNTKIPSTRSVLSDKNIKEKGFTKLVNEGGGKYRKV